MSILARYKKPGGFKQLLKLIETSQPIKQAKLLEVVEKEDPSWAKLILEKKITTEMVLSWDIDPLTKIFENMIPQHSAVILKSLGDEKILEFRQMFKLEKYKELKEIIDNLSEIKDSSLIAAENNMLETVRYLDDEKKIILRFIDPLLDLGDAA